MALFQRTDSNASRRTMLAYRVRFWPISELSNAGRELVLSNRVIYVRKSELLEHCNDELTHVSFREIDYPIFWAWNNIPTQQEWDKKSNSYFIRIELRVSGMINGGKCALLSFELPSSRMGEAA